MNVGSVIKNYKLVSRMKQGAQGSVFIVEEMKSHNQFVLKSLFIEESKKKDFENMVKTWKILCKSKSKNFIVSYIEHFYEGGNTVIIMEFCIGGDLETLIQKRAFEHEKFSENEVIKVLVEVMSILEQMHSLNFIHRDVKSANILIGSNGTFKLTDFNTSRIMEGGGGAMTIAGTLEYTPPEIVNSEEYSFSVDVYSTGVVLYQMMVGKTPFTNERGVVMKNLMTGKYEPISPSLGYSAPLIELIHSCLSLDPTLRPSPGQVLSSTLVVRAVLRNVGEKGERIEERCAELEKENERLREKEKKLEERCDVLEKEILGVKKEILDVKKENEELKEKEKNKEKEFREQLEQLRKDVDGMKGQQEGRATEAPKSKLTTAQTQISSVTYTHTKTPVVAATGAQPTSNSPTIVSASDSLSIINVWLGNLKKFTLLYKAVIDGFSGTVFHAKCNNRGETVVIVTSSEGYVFGGYAAVPWASDSSDGGHTADESGRSFLFSLKNPRNSPPAKFDLVNKRYALFCYSKFGPVFGFMHGITCLENSNTPNVNYTNLDGSNYANTTGLLGTTVFTGQNYFTAKDIEVYQVV